MCDNVVAPFTLCEMGVADLDRPCFPQNVILHIQIRHVLRHIMLPCIQHEMGVAQLDRLHLLCEQSAGHKHL